MATIPNSRDFFDDRTWLLPLTVEQYQRLMDTGIVAEGEPYELLDGYIVRKDRGDAGADPMTAGDRHAWAVQTLGILAPQLEPLGCHIRYQQPILLPPRDVPEPDGAIVGGTRHDTISIESQRLATLRASSKFQTRPCIGTGRQSSGFTRTPAFRST